ncbi:gp34.26 [Bacillus phage SPO1]|uniref:Gp34.26 n=3 Tax=Okubovirus TaxID=1857845 RepID=B6V2U3_BPSP1|nr:gp34.26 [Bacillus phage SPO1]YP_008770103.1 hypothetical protein CampHawk_169 [Bacillus phage CampHawk]APZ82406.1 hypothetical protein Goe2_c17000 [Bacillus phage vB_BsuM-Goe2]UNY49123.1 hypothetical protein sp82g_186 [Bacillus phage SP82G]ACI91070.1 gp34.26 [Bacillus phage SPO1]AGY47047.1 hypothetical protein CampHawk_169 [Bacillus phage CampHawk]
MMDLFFKLKVIDQILEWAIPLLVILTMVIWVLVAIETYKEKKAKRNKGK